MGLLAILGVVVAVAAAVAFRAWGPTTAPRPASTPTPSGVQAVLPQPARVVDGIPVGYPHTVQGAVSAAAHYTEARDLFSPKQVVPELKIMADPDPVQIGTLSSRGIIDAMDLRSRFGLDVGGESDQSDYVNVQAEAYHVDQAGTEQVEVWLLTWRTTVVGDVTQEHAAYTVPVALTWTGGDWKLDDRILPTSPTPATPGTPEATEAGWIPLVYAP